MEFENKVSEILDDEHKYITQLMISDYDRENKELFTLIPRNLFDSPIPFIEGEVYNIINSNSGEINLFKVVFSGLVAGEDGVNYLFDVRNEDSFDNIRTEIRHSVDKEAVYSDFVNTAIIRILDISHSGARIETDEKIISDYIEIFFDEDNTPKRALGKVLWRQFNEHAEKYMYGLKLDYRD